MIVLAAEKNFENKIKQLLKDQGCWLVKFFANAFTKSGIPDLLTCINGYFVAVEVKAPNGKPSELQKYHIRQINESGGIGIVLYPNQYHLFVQLMYALFDNDTNLAKRVAREINAKSDI